VLQSTGNTVLPGTKSTVMLMCYLVQVELYWSTCTQYRLGVDAHVLIDRLLLHFYYQYELSYKMFIELYSTSSSTPYHTSSIRHEKASCQGETSNGCPFATETFKSTSIIVQVPGNGGDYLPCSVLYYSEFTL
jgi:hypothetical protein